MPVILDDDAAMVDPPVGGAGSVQAQEFEAEKGPEVEVTSTELGGLFQKLKEHFGG